MAIVIDPRNWDAPMPAWWAPVHATFILGALSDPACDAVLLSAMRDAEAPRNDWISDAMPAILGARGRRLRPTLTTISRNAGEPEEVRCTALDGLAASTLVDPDGRDEVFALVAELFADPHQSISVRTHAANVLLDFQVREHAEALEVFARRPRAAR